MRNFIARSEWSRLDVFAACLSLLTILFVFAQPTIGRVEGRIAPVATNFTIRTVTPHGSGIAVTGSFNVRRPACAFHRLDWLILEDRPVRAQVTFGEGSVSRGGGPSSFGPWFVDITPEQLVHSHVVALHSCPGRPWFTETKLYP